MPIFQYIMIRRETFFWLTRVYSHDCCCFLESSGDTGNVYGDKSSSLSNQHLHQARHPHQLMAVAGAKCFRSCRKRRKTRTAFTNQQLGELERRFGRQKYLTPADRDDIASTLQLSAGQVITWFQNRRAKLKRDLEELKADVAAAKALGTEPSTAVLDRLAELTRASCLHQSATNLGVSKKDCKTTARSRWNDTQLTRLKRIYAAQIAGMIVRWSLAESL